MPKYIYNGKEFTEQEVAEAAAAKDMTLENYISNFGIEVVNDTEKPVTETVQEDFQTDPVKETASAGSMKTAVDTASPLADGSSGSSLDEAQQEGDWDFWEETGDKIKAATISTIGNLSRIPTFLNEIKASVSREFLTEEEQKAYDALDPVTKQVLANMTGPNVGLGVLANLGLEKYTESVREADKVRENLTKFETSILLLSSLLSIFCPTRL